MICRIGETVVAGRAVCINKNVDPERMEAAVRHGVDGTAKPTIEIKAADPGSLYQHIGCIRPELSLQTRTALAVAARSRGWSTDVDDDLASIQKQIAELSEVTVPNTATARAEVAERSDAVERLRERVAAERGRAAAGDEAADIEGAVRELSEAETALAAARERLRATREEARTARNRLREHLQLRDRAKNLERSARRELVERARPEYLDALNAVPGINNIDDPFDMPTDAMALAIARVGSVSAPIVLRSHRFADATTAADWLAAPVIQLKHEAGAD
ncbi:MAG: hypothetical protein ABEH64_08785 [Salinirussus sp.]